MKAFKVHNTEEVKQEVNLPAGTYTYSFRVIPVGASYTFRLDNQSFTFEGLTAGVLNKRMKHTFELTEAVSFFYLSNTVGDCVYEPQIEEGVFATTPGAHPLDFERLISEAGIEIDHEALSLYAKKADVTAEIKIQTDRIDSTVGNISNDVDEVKGDMTIISQTVNSITSTVTNHTTQISTFQQTVDQIYASIEDVGSGEFSHILQRIDEIEIKVGAPGQSGSIQLALDSIALTVYDENTGMSAISQKVNSITSTVYDKHDALLSQISQDGSNVKISGSHIALEGLVTANNNFKILADGSIEAKNGKFTGEINATSGKFTGEIVSAKGQIGGFNIGSSYIGTGATAGGGASGMSLWDDFIVFNKSGRQAIVGPTEDLGFKYLGRFRDTYTDQFTYLYPKTGVVIEVSGGSKNNALDVTGDIALKGDITLKGVIDGFGMGVRQISTGYTLDKKDNYITCYNTTSINVYLPSTANRVAGRTIYVRRMNTANVVVYGNGTTISHGNSARSTSISLSFMSINDTAMFVYDGQYWCLNWLQRNPS